MHESPDEKYLLNRLKMRHLRLLVDLAERRSVAEVAASLNVTQPAVSKALGELEEGLGIALFERAGRRLKPTAHGECLVRHARAMLAGMRCAQEELRALSGGIAGRVNVGVLSVAAQVLMPNALKLLKSSWPGITVRLREGTLDQHLPDLRTGKLDLVVGRLVSALRAPDLDEEVLYTDPVVIVISSTHPLASKARPRWADLEGMAWILPPEGAPMHDQLLALLARHGVGAPQDVIESISFLTNLPLLLSTTRLGLLPESLALQQAQAGALHILPLRLEPQLGPVGMIWSEGRPQAPAVRTLQQCLRAASRPRD